MTSKTIKQTILTADEGMYLTDGETFGKTVILPENANVDDWKEVTEVEYNAFVEQIKAEKK